MIKHVTFILVLVGFNMEVCAETGAAEAPPLSAAALAGSGTVADASPAGTSRDYLVGAGDILEISVWKEEGLTKEVLVRPDGGITFPLVGEVQAGGKTVDQINVDILKGLSSYLSEPAVNVAVKMVNQKFYVVGKVNKPGEFVSPARIDVLQALSMAGGLTPFADDDDIRIIRHEGDRVVSFPFDYSAISNGENMEQNILLRRGDVVVVP